MSPLLAVNTRHDAMLHGIAPSELETELHGVFCAVVFSMLFSWLVSIMTTSSKTFSVKDPKSPKRSTATSSTRKKTYLLILLLGTSIPFASAASVEVDLTQFTVGVGARFIGAATDSYIGRNVATIGDHNGDGVDDYIFGAIELDVAVIVMKKNTAYTEMSVSSIVSGQYFRVIKGPANSNLGGTVGGVGDINGDSFDDVIVGALTGQVSGRGGAGFAFVIFGMAGPFTDVTVTGAWAPSSIGFLVIGPPPTTYFLYQPDSARGLGDVNGDGVDDFAVSAYYYGATTAKNDAGVTWLIFGKKSPATFDTVDLLPANFGSNGVYYVGASAGDYLGLSVMPAGDCNGDGIADFLMSATAKVYLIHGTRTALATMDMSTFVTGPVGVRFTDGTGAFGSYMSGVGDVNGDGIDDIAFFSSAFVALGRPNGGAVFVRYGTRAAITADVNVKASFSFTTGFAIQGRALSVILAAVMPAGDVNGDGVNDIIVGELSANGRAMIVYGQTAVRTTHVDTLTASVTSFTFIAGANLGNALSGGEDVNGDGIPDILIGGKTATVTPAGGGAEITSAGAVWMVPGPFILPTDAPTAPPTTKPTSTPTLTPTLTPSAIPSVDPSVVPSISPSLMPSVIPSVDPSAVPSISPSLMPSVVPSVDPSTVPSISPSLMPSTVPSADPSAIPSVTPTLAPSVNPSASPSTDPTNAPTVIPSTNPSVSPSADPTPTPTMLPTAGPTNSPTASPTARPTVIAVKNFELVVNVEQGLQGVGKDDYDAQQAAYNRTIQHTVADGANSIIPERVTEIVVEEEEEGGRVRSFAGTAQGVYATGSVRLKYKVTVFDPVLTVEKLRAQLAQAAQEGKMDTALRTYAAQFGALGLNNGTFAEPQVTSAAVQRDASEKLTGVQIALLVICVLGALGLMASFVWFARCPRVATVSSPVAQREGVDAVL